MNNAYLRQLTPADVATFTLLVMIVMQHGTFPTVCRNYIIISRDLSGTT